MLLDWIPVSNYYAGNWLVGSDTVIMVFNYDPLTAIAYAWCDWVVYPTSDWGFFPTFKIPIHPALLYHAASVDATNFRWTTELTITG